MTRFTCLPIPGHRTAAAAVLLLLSFTPGCTSSPAAPTPPPTPNPTPAPASQFVLSGTWQRTNSTFATLDGMVVEVSADGTQAVITAMPANPYQFQVGDVKWRNITRESATRFAFEDLVRQSGSGAMSYVAGFIDAQPGGSELAMTFPSTGTLQQWRKP
jgi:hypothetical protein